MDADESPRYTVAQAAEALGISEAAVRARIQRGTLPSERVDGTVYVRLSADESSHDASADSDVIAVLREYNTALNRELQAERAASSELRRIVAGLVQRVPELEAASEPRESPVTASEDGSGTQQASQGYPEREEAVSWWRRLFGG